MACRHASDSLHSMMHAFWMHAFCITAWPEQPLIESVGLVVLIWLRRLGNAGLAANRMSLVGAIRFCRLGSWRSRRHIENIGLAS
jgi:hypothetical protein